MDTIGNFLTTLRNASSAHLNQCSVQWSKMRESIAKILLDEGFITGYRLTKNERGQQELEISLKYLKQGNLAKVPAIVKIERKSTPGCRRYVASDAIPVVLDGLGLAILTTSKGVMNDREARRQGVGGELLCTVW